MKLANKKKKVSYLDGVKKKLGHFSHLVDRMAQISYVGVVMGYGPSSLFTIQVGSYIFLAQNCIGLEPSP